MRKAVRAFDRHVQKWVDRLPRSFRNTMLFLTLIGQPPFTVGIATAVMGYGWALQLPHYLWAGATAIGVIVLTALLKLALRRPRPRNSYVKHMLFQTFSFPSGHAAGALASYGLVAAIVTYLAVDPFLTVVTWVTMLALAFGISLSRLYLKAHYASDIIGGWIVGGIGLLLIVTELLVVSGNS